MKKEDLRAFLNKLIRDYENERKERFHEAKLRINDSTLEDLKTLQARFGTNDLGKTLAVCIGLAKIISDRIENGGTIFLLGGFYY